MRTVYVLIQIVRKGMVTAGRERLSVGAHVSSVVIGVLTNQTAAEQWVNGRDDRKFETHELLETLEND